MHPSFPKVTITNLMLDNLKSIQTNALGTVDASVHACHKRKVHQPCTVKPTGKWNKVSAKVRDRNLSKTILVKARKGTCIYPWYQKVISLHLHKKENTIKENIAYARTYDRALKE